MDYICVTADEWNREYKNGYDKFLSKIDEKIRYQKLAEIINEENNSVLDLGCGTGVMETFLNLKIKYTGVDISDVAINLATQNNSGKYLCADISSYHTDCTFDVVLFNEILYYLNDPLGLLERFMKTVSNKGSIVCSLFHPFSDHEGYYLFEDLINQITEWISKKHLVYKQETIVNKNLRWEIIQFVPEHSKRDLHFGKSLED